MSEDAETRETFECFGSRCSAFVTGAGQAGSAQEAAVMARRALLAWHRQFSRFQPDSELSRLNRDPRERVPVSAMMALFARSVVSAGSRTEGLVDATLIDQMESAGYVGDLRSSLPLSTALFLAP